MTEIMVITGLATITFVVEKVLTNMGEGSKAQLVGIVGYISSILIVIKLLSALLHTTMSTFGGYLY